METRLAVIGAIDLPIKTLVLGIEAALEGKFTLEYAPGLPEGEYGGPPLRAKWLYWEKRGSWFVLPEGSYGRKLALALSKRIDHTLTMYEGVCEYDEKGDLSQARVTTLRIETDGRMNAVDSKYHEGISAEDVIHVALNTLDLPSTLEHEFGLYPLDAKPTKKGKSYREDLAELDAELGLNLEPDESVNEDRVATIRRLLEDGEQCELNREDEHSYLFKGKANAALMRELDGLKYSDQERLIEMNIYLNNATAEVVKCAAAELGITLGSSVWGPLGPNGIRFSFS